MVVVAVLLEGVVDLDGEALIEEEAEEDTTVVTLPEVVAIVEDTAVDPGAMHHTDKLGNFEDTILRVGARDLGRSCTR